MLSLYTWLDTAVPLWAVMLFWAVLLLLLGLRDLVRAYRRSRADPPWWPEQPGEHGVRVRKEVRRV